MVIIHTSEACDQVQKWLESRGKTSPNTIKAYRTDVLMLFREMELEEIPLQELEDLTITWLNARRRQMAPKTVSRRITSMRALGRAYDMTILKEYTGPTPPRTVHYPLPGGKDDILAMLQECKNDEQRALVVLTGLCGLRVSEARAVEPDHFNYSEHMLVIFGKGEVTRVVPVSPPAWNILLPIAMQTKFDGHKTLIRYADRSARSILTRLGEAAGVKRPVSSHDLRATFAGEAYNNGKDIRAVQELLGHASVDTTAIYTPRSTDEKRKAADFL